MLKKGVPGLDLKNVRAEEVIKCAATAITRSTSDEDLKRIAACKFISNGKTDMCAVAKRLAKLRADFRTETEPTIKKIDQLALFRLYSDEGDSAKLDELLSDPDVESAYNGRVDKDMYYALNSPECLPVPTDVATDENAAAYFNDQSKVIPKNETQLAELLLHDGDRKKVKEKVNSLFVSRIADRELDEVTGLPISILDLFTSTSGKWTLPDLLLLTMAREDYKKFKVSTDPEKVHARALYGSLPEQGRVYKAEEHKEPKTPGEIYENVAHCFATKKADAIVAAVKRAYKELGLRTRSQTTAAFVRGYRRIAGRVLSKTSFGGTFQQLMSKIEGAYKEVKTNVTKSLKDLSTVRVLSMVQVYFGVRVGEVLTEPIDFVYAFECLDEQQILDYVYVCRAFGIEQLVHVFMNGTTPRIRDMADATLAKIELKMFDESTRFWERYEREDKDALVQVVAERGVRGIHEWEHGISYNMKLLARGKPDEGERMAWLDKVDGKVKELNEAAKNTLESKSRLENIAMGLLSRVATMIAGYLVESGASANVRAVVSSVVYALDLVQKAPIFPAYVPRGQVLQLCENVKISADIAKRELLGVLLFAVLCCVTELLGDEDGQEVSQMIGAAVPDLGRDVADTLEMIASFLEMNIFGRILRKLAAAFDLVDEASAVMSGKTPIEQIGLVLSSLAELAKSTTGIQMAKAVFGSMQLVQIVSAQSLSFHTKLRRHAERVRQMADEGAAQWKRVKATDRSIEYTPETVLAQRAVMQRNLLGVMQAVNRGMFSVSRTAVYRLETDTKGEVERAAEIVPGNERRALVTMTKSVMSPDAQRIFENAAKASGSLVGNASFSWRSGGACLLLFDDKSSQLRNMLTLGTAFGLTLGSMPLGPLVRVLPSISPGRVNKYEMLVALAHRNGKRDSVAPGVVLMLLVDAVLGSRITRAIEVAREYATVDTARPLAMGEMAHRAFVSRMQVLLARGVPKPCGQYAAGATGALARKKEEQECVQRQMQLEYDLVRELVRTYGLAFFPKNEHMLLVEKQATEVKNRIVSSWRFWDAVSKKIAEGTLDKLVETHKSDVNYRTIPETLRPAAEAKIDLCEKARGKVEDTVKLANEMKEIIRMSYERNSREDFSKLDGVDSDCSEQIKEAVLDKIGESL
jgi:hypothetical protein